jgi:hypothetical protein
METFLKPANDSCEGSEKSRGSEPEHIFRIPNRIFRISAILRLCASIGKLKILTAPSILTNGQYQRRGIIFQSFRPFAR